MKKTTPEQDNTFQEKDNLELIGMENEISNILESFPNIGLLNGNHNYLLSANEEIVLAKLVQSGEKAKKRLKLHYKTIGKNNESEIAENNEINLDAINRKIEIGRLAGNVFIITNKGLVYDIAKRYSNGEKPTKDMLQEGGMGVIRAAKKFTEEKGTRFATYASWWIRQHILLHLRMNRPIYISAQLNQDLFTFRNILYDNNLKIYELSIKDIDFIADIGIFDKKYIKKLIGIVHSENLLSLDWEDEEGKSSLYETISNGKNNPEEDFSKNQLEKYIRSELENSLLKSENSSEQRQGIILVMRYDIFGLKEKVIELLVKLTLSGELATIEKAPSNLINIYMEYKDTILQTLDSILEIKGTKYEEQKKLIKKLCQKILSMEDNMDLIINEFRKRDDITVFLFCILETFNQSSKSNQKIPMNEIITNFFLEGNNNITNYYIFMKELLFLYSSKVTGKEISKEEIENLYKSFLNNIKSPTLQDLGVLFSVSRERIRQLEKGGQYKFKAHMLRKKNGGKKPDKNAYRRLEAMDKHNSFDYGKFS